MIIHENRGPYSKTKSYKISQGNRIEPLLEDKDKNETTSITHHNRRTGWLSSTFAEIFLPFAYPTSVTSDYASFQFWDVLQTFVSTLNASIAMESIFKAAGVGSENRSALATSMALLGMDVAAKVGEAVFIWTKGRALDYDNKKMRFLASILHDCALIMQLILPLFTNNVIILLLLCASSIASAVAGIVNGATAMSLTSHQAKMNNAADVCSKSHCQRQAAGLMANGICLILMPCISGNQTILILLHTILIGLHLSFNYFALKAVQLPSLNMERLLICLRQFLTTGTVPSIREVNQIESLILGFGMKEKDINTFRINFGASIFALKNLGDLIDEPLSSILQNYKDSSFLIIPSTQRLSIHVILRENIDPSEMLEAYVRCIIGGNFYKTHAMDTVDVLHPKITAHWEVFKKCLEGAGYNLKQVSLKTGESRAKWKDT